MAISSLIVDQCSPNTAKRSFLEELNDVLWNGDVGGYISGFWLLCGMVLWRVCTAEAWSGQMKTMKPSFSFKPPSSNTEMLHLNLQTIQPGSISLPLSTVPSMHLSNKTISLVYSDLLNDTVSGFASWIIPN